MKRGAPEGFHGHGPTLGLGMGLSDASHDRVHICLSMRNADARFETSDHIHPVIVAIELFRFEDQWHDQRRTRIPHARAKHSYYHVGLAIQMQDSTGNRRIGAEPLPHSLGKDDYVVFACYSLVRKKIPAQVETIAHHREETDGHVASGEVFRLSLGGDVKAAPGPCIQILKKGVLQLPVEEVQS